MIKKEEILQYLSEKFKEINPGSDGIQKRYDNYVQFEFANGCVEHILPYLKKGEKILDIGSGFGSFVYLLRREEFDAYGIEISNFHVQFAMQRLEENFNVLPKDSSQIYLEGSALCIPFPENYFGVITMWNVLEHIEDFKKALSEAIRVLKPEGKLFIMNVNYASCFFEPHYRLPWIPYLPKSIARYYLKCLGRTPEYIENGIFYVSNYGILKNFLKGGFNISNARIDKLLDKSPTIVSSYKKFIWAIIKFIRLEKLIIILLKALIYNPFCAYINLTITKNKE